MMKHSRLEHKFVHYIPEKLEPGMLYISMDYATAAHSCCCGCGEQVVTPFTPHDWQMTFDGETVSIWPSIGNWDYACRSHYVIKRSRVIEAETWSDEEIANTRHFWIYDRFGSEFLIAYDSIPWATGNLATALRTRQNQLVAPG